MTAYKHLQRIKREQLSLLELPIAQLCSLTANINRDTKRTPKPFALEDFALFYERDKAEGFPVEAAIVALSMRRDQRLPSVLVGVWPQLIEAAKAGGEMPKTRALVSDDNAVALLAPKQEGQHWRGLLAVTQYPPKGEVILRDLDRPLLTYSVRLGTTDHSSFVSDGELVLAN
jgi:hypothetical protein